VGDGARWTLNPERLSARDPRRKTDKSDEQTNLVQLSHNSLASLLAYGLQPATRGRSLGLEPTREYPGSTLALLLWHITRIESALFVTKQQFGGKLSSERDG